MSAPTQWAYEQACAALEKTKAERDVLAAEVARAQAIAQTFEDEADRLGAENKALRETVRKLSGFPPPGPPTF